MSKLVVALLAAYGHAQAHVLARQHNRQYNQLPNQQGGAKINVSYSVRAPLHPTAPGNIRVQVRPYLMDEENEIL